MGELRWHGRIYRDAAHLSFLHSGEQALKTLDIHGFGEHVLHDFIHQRMVGNLDVSLNVFLACGYIRKDGGEKIVRAHALDLRRNFLAPLETQKGQRAVCVPAPARAKDR